MMKILRNIGIEKNSQLVRERLKRTYANFILNGESLNVFPLKQGTRQGCPLP